MGKKAKKREKQESSVKRMPGEIEQEIIHIGMDCRTSLQHYYACGGKDTAFATFKGQVSQFKSGQGYLFKRLSVEFDDYGWNWDDHIASSEDHVWIYDYKPFEEAGIKVGDNVEFTALVYAYKRKDDSEDYALKAPQDIKKIGEYSLPEEPEGISDSFLESLVCETCMYTNHCNGLFCLAPEGYKDAMISFLRETADNLKQAASQGL